MPIMLFPKKDLAQAYANNHYAYPTDIEIEPVLVTIRDA